MQNITLYEVTHFTYLRIYSERSVDPIEDNLGDHGTILYLKSYDNNLTLYHLI